MPLCDAATGPDSVGRPDEVQALLQGTRSGRCNLRRFCKSLGHIPWLWCGLQLGVHWTSEVEDGGRPRARQFG